MHPQMEIIGRPLEQVLAVVAAAETEGAVTIETEHVISTFPGGISARLPLEPIFRLRQCTPAMLLPIAVGRDENGDLDVKLAGVEAGSADGAGIAQLLDDLAVAHRLLAWRNGPMRSFAAARADRLSAGARRAVIWAVTPTEAVVKLAIHLRPGFARDPVEGLRIEPGLAMRSLDDWNLHPIYDIADAAARRARLMPPEFPSP